jgi:hypothetical protein
MLPQTLGQHRPAKTDDMKMIADLKNTRLSLPLSQVGDIMPLTTHDHEMQQLYNCVCTRTTSAPSRPEGVVWQATAVASL